MRFERVMRKGKVEKKYPCLLVVWSTNRRSDDYDKRIRKKKGGRIDWMPNVDDVTKLVEKMFQTKDGCERLKKNLRELLDRYEEGEENKESS